MPSNTPNVGAPLWAASQATPWLTENEAARIWDAFAVTVIVERMDLTAPPGACADGARYLVKGVATGLWSGHDGDLAIAVGANASNGWYFAEVGLQGMLLYNRAEARNYRYESGIWTAFVDTLSRFQDLLDVTLAGLADGDLFVWDASNGVLFPQTVANLIAPILLSYLLASNNLSDLSNIVTARSNLGLGSVATATLDTDGTLAANSDSSVASQKAVRTYVGAKLVGMFDLRGSTDCSTNPNYPAATKGDAYIVTVGGKIGGASGTTVAVGDVYFATADNAGGTQAGVGASWDVVIHAGSLTGALLAANNLSDVVNAATARANLGLGTSATVDTGTSGTKVALTDGANTWSAAQTDSALHTFSLGANMTPAAAPATNAVGYLGAPQNIQNASYTTVMSDAGKHLYHTSGTAHTWTIDSNANVAYPIGTILTFINENGGGVITLAITTDTLRWGSSTGPRSLAANGTATAIKVTATVWRLTGDGIT